MTPQWEAADLPPTHALASHLIPLGCRCILGLGESNVSIANPEEWGLEIEIKLRDEITDTSI